MRTKSTLFVVFLLLYNLGKGQDSTLKVHQEQDWMNYVNTIDMNQNELAQEENPIPSSLLLAGRNYFLNVYSFSFFNVRYRQRGYENFSGRTYINGVPINSLETNNIQYGLFSGMSNVFKVEETSEQLATSDFSFGGIGNHFSLSTSPMNQRNKLRVNYTFSNRNYQHRIGVTYNRGFNRKGWNYLIALNGRGSSKGYYPGTYYEGSGFLFSLDKKFRRNLLSFAVWAAESEAARQAPAVKEAFQLLGNNYYNPQWGYENGKRRNASIQKSFLPTFSVRYKANFKDQTFWNTAIAVTKGRVSFSGLEWYNAPDPRPDYYRYLPSYFSDDSYQNELLMEKIKTNPNLLQIDWDKMININRSQESGRSLYALGKRTTEMFEINSVSTIASNLNPSLKLNAGIEFQLSKQRYYKEMSDLLGGQYWLNINAFIERNNPSDISVIQNDVDHPNRKVIVGDKYSYDYILQNRKFSEWIQLSFNKRKWDAFGALEFGAMQVSREGKVRTGLFPNNSLGCDHPLTNINWIGKIGLTYKIDGRKYFFVNAALLQQAPLSNSVYISPTTRNFRNDSARVMKLQTIETGFVVNTPKLRMRASAYCTLVKNVSEFRYFYDDIHQNFASYMLNNIEKKHYGLEFAMDWNFIPNWTYSLVSNYSKSLYNNRPRLIVTSETSPDILLKEDVYMKNYRVANTPQSIVHNSIGYRNAGIFFTLDFNAFFDRWSALNPIRRTYSALQDINPVAQKELLYNITKQEKLPNGHTFDLFGGYSFLVKRHKKNFYYLDLLLSGNNLLGKKDIVGYAFEQMRLDTKEYSVDKFPNKYSYAMGRNYSVNIAFRF